MLTEQEIEHHGLHVKHLKLSADSLADAIARYNSTMIDAQYELEEELRGYNVTLADARRFVDGINDKYSDTESLVDWSLIDLDEYEIHFPRELDEDAPDHAREFAALTTETEEV